MQPQCTHPRDRGAQRCWSCEVANRAATADARLSSRFWSKVARGTDDACWVWQASRANKTYGGFRLTKTKLARAHVFAYEQTHGPVPDGLELDHLCRNRLCVNPAHLEPVTRLENTLRGKAGEHNRKLTDEQRREIYHLRGIIPGVELARRYGVSKCLVSHIQLHDGHLYG